MCSSIVSVSGAGHVTFVPGIASGASTRTQPVAGGSAVKQLLNQLFYAEQGSKKQLAQDLRDKLNDLREELGAEQFKNILGELAAGSESPQFRQLLQPLLGPRLAGGLGVGGGAAGGGPSSGRVYGSGEKMSNKPILSGANYFNYRPDRSNPGKKPNDIWSGFSQGPDGNCVTVSAIKAAMMQFGQKPTDVFKEVKETDDGYYVKMRDGFELHLTKDELRQAALASKFKGTDPEMLADAIFMFAVSGKRIEMEGNGIDDDINKSKRSYADALESMNNGEAAHEALDRLGLRGLYRPSTSSELANGRLGIVAYDGHSMAVIGGLVEMWGTRGGHPKAGIAYTFL